VAQKITFSATIGGKKYTATTPAAVTLGRALIHTYTLTLSAQGMTVGEVSVEPWGSGVTGSLTLAPIKTIDLKTAPNGVYAVNADGKGMLIDDADETCIGVALIVNDAPTPQKLMIEKNEANNTAWGGNTDFYWDQSYSDLSLENFTDVGGGATGGTGYLMKPDGTFGGTSQISYDHNNWTSGAISDFNGKNNTTVIVAASDDTRDMGSVLKTFNADEQQNQGYNDWYIPACGQLALMYLNMTAINNALTKIGGQTIPYYTYWSSSEYSSNSGWSVGFNTGRVEQRYGNKSSNYRVRFVRDI